MTNIMEVWKQGRDVSMSVQYTTLVICFFITHNYYGKKCTRLSVLRCHHNFNSLLFAFL